MGAAVPQVVTESSASGAQVIDGSLKFDGGQNLTRTPGSTGNRRTWTWSSWVKRCKIGQRDELFTVWGSDTDSQVVSIQFDSNDTLTITQISYTARVTSQVFRDPSSFYHLVVSFNTTENTANDRIKAYINGSQITDFSTTANPSQNSDTGVNGTYPHHIGRFLRNGTSTGYANIYLSEVNFIDGQALGPESFGFTDLLTNTWRPKKYTGSFNAPAGTGTVYSANNTGNTNPGLGWDKAFNGQGPSGAGGYVETSNGATGSTLTLNVPFTTLEFAGNGSGFEFNGTGVSISGAYTFTNISSSITSPLTSIKITQQSVISAIKVDGVILANPAPAGVNGFYLPMDGNSSIGHDKSKPNPINNEIIWSSGIAGSQDTSSGGGAAAAFDGTTGSSDSNGSYPTPGQTLTWTPANSSLGTTLPYSSTIRVHVKVDANGDDGGLIVIGANGSQTIDAGGSGQKYVDISAATSPITSIAWSRASSGGQGVGLQQVEVDGVVLVDGIYGNGWTPVNFGGSVALPKATGALPILNTDGGGNVARPGVFGSEASAQYTTTSATNSGGKYVFENEGTQPTFSFIRGATYTFDYNASTGHPLRFATAADAAGSTQYTDGTNTSVSNVISFTVPHNAPNTLYYYCTNHSGMGNSISVTTDETKADPYAWKNVLALPLVGSKDDVSNSVNSGSTTKTATPSGALLSSAASNFYNESFFFDGSNDYIGVTNDSSFRMGSSDFTLEAWVYPSTVSGERGVFSLYETGSSRRGYIFGINGGKVWWLRSDAGSSVKGDSVGSIAANVWSHIALTKTGSTTLIFINGILVSTITDDYSSLYDNTTTTFDIGVGDRTNGGVWFSGYIQDARVYKGVRKYTNSFVVPATSPDILPDTPSGVSGSSKLAKITDGAVAFDGSGDFLSLTGSSDVQFGTGIFTTECFVYSDGYPGSGVYGIFDTGTSVNANRFSMVLYPSGLISIDSNVNLLQSSSAMRSNAWNHVAFVREGTGSNQAKLYINGVLSNQATISTDFTNDDLLIGKTIDNLGWKGFISNVRLIKGTALYTSNFTPPAAPLTNVTNTKLLCCQSNALAGSAAVVPGASGINDGTPWSEFVTIPEGITGTNYNDDASNAFDGDTSSQANLYSGNMVSPYSSTTVIFTPPSPITVSSGLRVYMAVNRGQNIVVNGTQTNASVSAGWNDTGFTGTLTSLTLGPTILGSSSNPTAFEVDGVILKNLVSPKGNVSATNFNPFTTDIDTVRGQETGYPTFNPLYKHSGTANTYSDGNLVMTAGVNNGVSLANMSMPTSGKWYAEIIDINSSNGAFIGGVGDPNQIFNNFLGRTATGWGYQTHASNASYYNNNVYGTAGQINGHGNNTVLNVAVDRDNGYLWFGINGVYVNGGNPSAGTGYLYSNIPVTGDLNFGGSSATGLKVGINCGQKPFKFPPPEGFQPLNATNVRPETVITRPDQFVGTTLYSGNTSTQSINVGLNPDFVWIKKRSGSADHYLYDTVRGATYRLYSNTTDAESTSSTGLTAFTSDGFTLGNANDVNQTSNTYVAWSWRAGGDKNTFNVDDVGYANASDVGMNIGGQNSNAYNQSKTWSTAATITGSPDSASYSYSNVFDGTPYVGATAQANNTRTPYVYRPSYAINGSTIRIRIAYYGNPNDDFFQVNSVSYGNAVKAAMSASTATWITLPIQTINTTNGISIKADGTNSFNLAGIEVDGKLLVDSGVTPANVPSIANTGASVGTKQGFSIVTYNGSGSNGTFGHGLLETPNLIIVKCRNVAQNWAVQHSAYGPTKYTYLQSTNAASTTGAAAFWNNIAPTNTTVSVGTDNDTNSSGKTYVAYCWHDVPGLQKFGSYEGNGSADGTFVELGFRPSIILTKNIDNYGTNYDWCIYDNTRSTFNPNNKFLCPNLSYQENYRGDNTADNARNVDFLSNGFKIRNNSSPMNLNAHTIIYAAWAEAPTVNLFGAQSNAR